MVSEKEIYQSANQVIKKCSNHYNPKEYAQSQMCRHYEMGDTEGATVWAKIANAIDELTRLIPKGFVH